MSLSSKVITLIDFFSSGEHAGELRPGEVYLCLYVFALRWDILSLLLFDGVYELRVPVVSRVSTSVVVRYDLYSRPNFFTLGFDVLYYLFADLVILVLLVLFFLLSNLDYPFTVCCWVSKQAQQILFPIFLMKCNIQRI